MAATTLREERSVIREGSAQKFQIRVYCTAAGDLADTGLFVHQIIDQANPLRDVFTRIAEIVDFTPNDGFLANRLAATIRHDEYWRSSEMSKIYDDIETANAAVKAIFDRVNALVNEYKTYSTSFQTSGEDIVFPTTDPSLVELLKEAYATAYAAYTAAQAAQSHAKTALSDAEASLAKEQTELQQWLDMRAKFQEEADNDKLRMSGAYSSFNDFVSSGDGNARQTLGAIDAFLFAYRGKFGSETRKVMMAASGYVDCVASDIGKTVTQQTTGHTGKLIAFNNVTREWWIAPQTSDDVFTSSAQVVVEGGSSGKGNPSASVLVGSGPVDADVSSLQTARDSFDAARQQAVDAVAAAALGVAHHSETATYISNQVTQHTTAVTQAQNDVSKSQTEYNKAQGDVQTAYTMLEKAYNDVKAVCPNWTPAEPFPPIPSGV